ncbi:hypothetical protein LR48_Vigan11g112300 [Vigna angularis]|uniref:Uncharacterized protein n=1 Tax=Phaseolus angularis TaxID=3914 RepID=A0A0L9VTK8_PHAAN|nr:hypothetical protein LR48_Vigan11g112300 [Vigna angularis]
MGEMSVVKWLGYDGFKDLWFFVGCGLVLDDRLEVLCDDVGVKHTVNLARLNGQFGEATNDGVCRSQSLRDGGVTQQLNEGVGADGERIKVDVGQAEIIEAYDVKSERIEVHEDHDEMTETNEVEGERIEVDEGDGERTKVDDVEGPDVEGERIQVDEGHGEAERRQAHDGEAERLEVQDVEGERIQLHDVEVDRIEVQDLEDIKVQVCELSTSDDDDDDDDDDGEVNSMDGLVNINVQCDFRQSESSGNMEVEVEFVLVGTESSD